MEKQFVPYELALKLKELGFNEECFDFYDDGKELFYHHDADKVHLGDGVKAPLFQQAFDWFREKYKIHGWVVPYFTLVGVNYSCLIMDENMRNLEDEVDVGTYQEAHQACLEKLIEIVENENRTH